ncbi:hypothetical protein LXL04_004753 [Taraxacum kok-saghyz]
MGAGVCYRCWKAGHMSTDCKEVTKMCFNCNQFGHVKSECPKLVGRVVQPPATTTLQITDGKTNHDMSSGVRVRQQAEPPKKKGARRRRSSPSVKVAGEGLAAPGSPSTTACNRLIRGRVNLSLHQLYGSDTLLSGIRLGGVEVLKPRQTPSPNLMNASPTTPSSLAVAFVVAKGVRFAENSARLLEPTTKEGSCEIKELKLGIDFLFLVSFLDHNSKAANIKARSSQKFDI